MIKLISINELRPGMFIIDVANTWSKSLNLPKKMFIENETVIEKLRNQGIREIFIDSKKTVNVQPVMQKAKEIYSNTNEIQILLKEGERVQAELENVINSIINDVGTGKKIELKKVNPIVRDIVDLASENHYLLAGLVLMRRKNQYIYEHALSNAVLMIAFAKTYRMDKETQKNFGIGAMLLDIGMTKIPSKILNKREKLKEHEILEIQRHVQYGYDLLSGVDGINECVLEMIAQHHERMNGSGYQFHLKGEEISLAGQMAAIVDVYNAATSDHGYKKAITPVRALADILLKSDSIFNSELVNIFIKATGIYPFGSLVRLKNSYVGVVTEQNDELLYPHLRIIYDLKKGGLITPFNLSLIQHKDDDQYAISGVIHREELFLKENEIKKLISIN